MKGPLTGRQAEAFATAAPAHDALVYVENVEKYYRGSSRRETLAALRGVSLSIHRGEVFALVGESGSGKSTLGRILVRLVAPSAGEIWFDGKPITRISGTELRQYRRKVSIVFQNPYRSLNPRMRVGDALAEVLAVCGIVQRHEADVEVAKLLENVALPADYSRRYPHEMSGGERQRVAIARALAVNPQFMVADEPVSSLDVSAAADILNLLMKLRHSRSLTCLFITHDLGVARVLADRVAVMRTGDIVETGTPTSLFREPQHEYTETLVASQVSIPTRRT